MRHDFDFNIEFGPFLLPLSFILLIVGFLLLVVGFSEIHSKVSVFDVSLNLSKLEVGLGTILLIAAGLVRLAFPPG